MALAQTIERANGGEVVCLAEGVYPALRMIGGVGEAGRSAYVTIRPRGSDMVVFGGKLEVSDSSFERYEHIRFDAPVNLDDLPGYGGSHDYELLHDTWEHSRAGLGIEGGRPSASGGGGHLKNVLLEDAYMSHIDIARHGAGHTGECHAESDGQAVTVARAEGIVVRRSTFVEAQWHYIQGGSAGPRGMLVEGNLFAGEDPYECAHLNIWQIYGEDSENDTFRDNVVEGRGTSELPGGGHEEASVDWLQWENGAGAGECGVHLRRMTVEGNLVVDANNAQIWTVDGLVVRHNTVVGAHGGLSLLTTHCGPGRDYVVTHNLGAQAPINWARAMGGNVFDFNVTTGPTAAGGGSRNYVAYWTPRWRTTAWDPFTALAAGVRHPHPPPGYYVPLGLPFPVGYASAGP